MLGSSNDDVGIILFGLSIVCYHYYQCNITINALNSKLNHTIDLREQVNYHHHHHHHHHDRYHHHR